MSTSLSGFQLSSQEYWNLAYPVNLCRKSAIIPKTAPVITMKPVTSALEPRRYRSTDSTWIRDIQLARAINNNVNDRLWPGRGGVSWQPPYVLIRLPCGEQLARQPALGVVEALFHNIVTAGPD
ncbi:hypothetical protein RRG08_012088 [Elysia crispata]|uniref:Uncharacterized protein n=1 Tax=Elysia crispata TaxID=231223 RepID=A0AAE0YTR8_9GAST|nr:hypothetical protein RRG08_012088 [Elysia crispata]